jgi:hypothetical protein
MSQNTGNMSAGESRPASAKARRGYAVGAVLIVASAILLVFAGFRLYVSQGAAAIPQRITVRELLTKGPGDNRHVLIEGCGYFPNEGHSGVDVYFEISHDPMEGEHHLWVMKPTFSSDSLAKNTTVQGIVRAPSWGESDFAGDNSLVIVEGRRPAGWLELLTYLAIAAVASGLGYWLRSHFGSTRPDRSAGA